MTRSLVRSVVGFALAVTGAAGADPYPAPDDPLPKGAKARLGTARGGPTASLGRRYIPTLLPGGKSFLTSDAGGHKVYDLATGRTSAVQGFAGGMDGVALLAVSDDGRRAVSARGGECVVWDVNTGKVVGTVKPAAVGAPHWPGYRVSLSADGRVMAFDDRGAAVVQDVDVGVQLARVEVLHDSAVYPVLSPDGKTLATHGHSKAPVTPPPDPIRPATVVQLWDVTTGKLLGTLPDVFPERPDTSNVIFSTDGKTLATCGGEDKENVIRFWNAATGKETGSLLCRVGQGKRIAFSPDGRTFASVGQDGSVDRWSFPDCKPLKSTPFPRFGRERPPPYGTQAWAVAGLRFVDNDRVVAWGAWGDRALAWEAPAGTFLTATGGHTGGVSCVRFGPGDREVVTAGRDFRALRWEPTGKLIGEVPMREPFWQFPWTHLGPDAARGLRASVMYDLRTGEEEFAFPFGWPLPSPDFTRLAGYRRSRDGEKDPSVCEVWDTVTRRRVCRIDLPPAVDNNVLMWNLVAAFSPDNSRLVTALGVRTGRSSVPLVVTGWDATSGKKLGEFIDPGNSWVVGITAANNTSCVISTADGKLWVVDFERGVKGEVIDTSPVPELHRISVPTFSPNGKLFAAGVPTGEGREYAVRVYDWPRGNVLHTFDGHAGPVTAMAFSSDGKTLASASEDSTVLLWDVSNLPSPK